MFYFLTLMGWAVFDAYSGFTLFVLWVCHSLCTPSRHSKTKSDSPNAHDDGSAVADTVRRYVGGPNDA